ncbi:MAG: 4-hydroxythreonine-4-phosphate dehydrogenase PdxA [Planctomycetales bacterium]|nr:4-hydroxythreonine-4-phosphate dehydrogenase PdxA [Planctomycetales bacterium]
MNASLPRIAVTMGDPAGVGPEICLRLLANAEIAARSTPIVFGSAPLLARVADRLRLPLTAPVITCDAWPAAAQNITTPTIVDFPIDDAAAIAPGGVDARCGAAAFALIQAAIDAALAGQVDAVTTGPINKESLHAAGHRYPGHTELFAERMDAASSCMMLTSAPITCSFVTAHVGLFEVPDLLSTERVAETIRLTHEAMRRMRGAAPRLAVCGLNPHAGEHGLFGRQEEERIIAPAVRAAQAAGLDIEGPLPPDTAFLPGRRATTDAFVCMYHDQGIIPLKALAFDEAVNITLGLPMVRTSVDHGTAFDIAWQGVASPNSLLEAVRLAARLCRCPQ